MQNESNAKYIVKCVLLFTRTAHVIGITDKEKMLLDADMIFVSDITVTGWNTRVTFQVAETFLSRNPLGIGAEKDDNGYIDFKNDERNVMSDLSCYFSKLSK